MLQQDSVPFNNRAINLATVNFSFYTAGIYYEAPTEETSTLNQAPTTPERPQEVEFEAAQTQISNDDEL